MSAYGVADSDELNDMTKALETYCAVHRITDKEGRERIALKVVCLFRRGITALDRMSEELERVR